MIINDVKRSSHYNQKVDLNSILPIYALPLINKEGKVLAVIEVREKIN